MRKQSRQLAILIHALIIVVSILPGGAGAQRPDRPPARDFEGTPVLAAGIEVVPEGTYLLLEMETRLSSRESRQSDRFQARLASPVVDARGRTLIPEAAYVVGHVSAVRPAKWRRRSGIISVEFDYLYMPSGQEIPIRGYLTSADAEDRHRIDEEGTIRGGAPRKRDIVFIGGGAGAGAAIGMIAGGTLAGAGIGAAVGLTATLLMKGQEAVVEEGQRIALGLTEDLRVEQTTDYPAPEKRIERPTSPIAPSRPISNGSENRGDRTDSSQSQVGSGSVNLSAIRSERSSDGLIRILITAETPSTGWRIFTNHEISRDTVEVHLSGVAPAISATRQISHPTAPTIVIQDRTSRIQKIVVRGKNTVQSIGVNSSWTDRGSKTSTTRPGTNSPPRDNNQGDTPSRQSGDQPGNLSGTSTGKPSPEMLEASTRIEKEIDLIRYNFASSIGIWLNKDGTYDVLTGRTPSGEEKRFLDGLGALSNSVRVWHYNSPTAASRRSNSLRIREDALVVESSWKRISMSSETNQMVRNMLGEVRILSGSIE